MATTDVWDALENPEVKAGSSDYFGQVKIDTFFAVLVKGMGKVPFDPAQHSADQRVTAIEMVLIPLAEMNISWDVSRGLIAESREWAGIVLPSIKDLGKTPRELNNCWVRITKEPTGKTYTSKRDNTQKNETTFKFLQVFGSEQECRAAYQAFAAGAGTVPAQAPAAAAPSNGNGNGNGNGASKEKETALKFLRVVVENAARGQSDLGVIQRTVAANIAGMPMVNKYYTADSPETLQLMAEAMSK